MSFVNEQSWNCLEQPKLATATERLINALLVTFKHCLRFCNIEISIQLFVKKGGGKNLLGMDWLKKVGLAQPCNTYLYNLGNQNSRTKIL